MFCPLCKGQTILPRESLVAVANERNARERVVHGCEPSNVFLDILADLHFEEAKCFLVPSAREGDGLVEVGDRNGDVGLSRSQVCATPKLPHRDLRCAAIGIEHSGFKPTVGGRMSGRLFR
jgi:hypothetical protein